MTSFQSKKLPPKGAPTKARELEQAGAGPRPITGEAREAGVSGSLKG